MDWIGLKWTGLDRVVVVVARCGVESFRILSSPSKQKNEFLNQCMADRWAFEDVWGLRELAELLLRRLDVDDLVGLRGSCRTLKHAVDEWGIERLVVRDDIDGHQPDPVTLTERFPAVRQLVLRSVSPRTLDALVAFASKGKLASVDYDECELGEDVSIVRGLPSMPVERLVVKDCVFASQEGLDSLCAVHPAGAVRIENVGLKLAEQQELMILGNEEQQFAARLCASRKQCVIPDEFTACDSFSFKQNIHLSPQRPLWKSPAALERMQATLERLDLSGNALALENVQLLFYEGEFSRLAKLRLRACSLTESHMEIISMATSCVSLEHLDLSGNRLGTPIALYYLASSEQLTSQLRWLSLADQEETTEDWLYGLALTTSHWERLETFNASYSSNIGASSMLGICESMPFLRRLLLPHSYVTKDALALFGRSPLFGNVLEEVDLSVEARRVEDCFCAQRATRLKKLTLAASATRQSRKYDRKALKLLKAMHGDHVAYIIRGL